MLLRDFDPERWRLPQRRLSVEPTNGRNSTSGSGRAPRVLGPDQSFRDKSAHPETGSASAYWSYFRRRRPLWRGRGRRFCCAQLLLLGWAGGGDACGARLMGRMPMLRDGDCRHFPAWEIPIGGENLRFVPCAAELPLPCSSHNGPAGARRCGCRLTIHPSDLLHPSILPLHCACVTTPGPASACCVTSAGAES
jgi:hypothetical protein